MVPLVYSPNYNITACGLERLHPFDSRKYRRIHDWLIRQGLRTAAQFHVNAIRSWPWAHILDFFQVDIFPWPKVEEEIAVRLPARIGGAAYLAQLQESLPPALDHYRPDFVLYNAGSDVLSGDLLAQLGLSANEMAERDLVVVTEVRERGIPLAMVLSGGYGSGSWIAHAQSIEGILARFDKTMLRSGEIVCDK